LVGDRHCKLAQMIRWIKLIIGTLLLAWASLLFLANIKPTPPPIVTATTKRERYVEIAALLTPFVFVAVGLSLVLSARRTKKL
jgi:hypothetical protein